MVRSNRRIVLAARPIGPAKESDFRLVVDSAPQPAEGQILIRNLFLSVDPYIRGRMNGVRTYSDPQNLNETMVSGAVGEVIESKHSGFSAGDFVEGYFGWQDYAVSNGAGVRKVDPSIGPVSTALGVFGMPGMTAYFGLLDIGKPKPGETVVVSAAAGAVGSLVGQIARIQGCRVVGMAGTDAKVDYLTRELGFDAAFNYKTERSLAARIRSLCPDGVDVYFDNVGGMISDAVMAQINTFARIVVCGQISQYNLLRPETGPRFLGLLLVRQAKAEGFLAFQYEHRYQEGIAQMAQWVKEGKLKYREEFTAGLETAPLAFIGMMQGQNTGKQLVKV